MSPYLQGHHYSCDSHTSSQNDTAEALLLGISASGSATDNALEGLFAGVPSNEDCPCTPGAGNLAYGCAAPDVDCAMKLAEKLEEEYQQLKRDVECWKARAEDTNTKILPLLKRRQMFSDALDITPSKCGHIKTNSLARAESASAIAPKKRRQLQMPFELSSCPIQSKTVAKAMSSIEGAIERQTLVLSRICEALGGH
ncbi:hypothetical protein BDR06DRAFT_1010437 [Suillus hirtellus]|nr:hypothetical protein BDR06DRAFT_1010437 [Suillus hirtellus]